MKKLVLSIVLWMIAVCGLQAQETYKVGDIYDKDGVKGIIYKVSEDGQHGMMMSIYKSTEAWLADAKYNGMAKAYNTSDGKENMKAVEDAITANNLTWDAFPIFKFAKDLGEGWYIPAAKELFDIMRFFADNEECVDGLVLMEQFSHVEDLNKHFSPKKVEGDPLLYKGKTDIKWKYYFYILRSSTATLAKNANGEHVCYAMFYYPEINKPYLALIQNNPYEVHKNYGTRAIRAF